MAFVFGSQVKGYARWISDWDIAVYLTKEDRGLEQDIWGEIERIVQAEVDLVVLNRAPAPLSWNILRTGLPLTIKNRGQYLSLLIRSGHEANDWYRTAEDYFRVFERSASLTREDRQRLERIIQFLEEEANDYEKFQKLTWQEYERERPKRREVERWAEQIINAVIDSAGVILASERRVIPETYRRMVQTLAIIPPFDQDDLCEKLAPWVELRNILAHEYLDYRWKELNIFIQETKTLLTKFIERLKNFLRL